MRCEFVPLIDFGLDRTAELLTRGLADYFVKIPFTAATLLQLARSDSVDLMASLVALRERQPLGAALIARRGWTSRVAGMAVVPEARRQGAGRELLERALADAARRGERAMVLEVIEQNEGAVRLYETAGFQRVRRLVGFSAAGAENKVAAGPLEKIDPRRLGAVAIAHGPEDMPWQLSGETLAQLTPPTTAYRRGGAWIAVSNLAAPQISIRAVVAPAGREAEATGLLRAVMAAHPGKEWRMSAIWPEEFSALFLDAGFTRTPLTQWQMQRLIANANTAPI